MQHLAHYVDCDFACEPRLVGAAGLATSADARPHVLHRHRRWCRLPRSRPRLHRQHDRQRRSPRNGPCRSRRPARPWPTARTGRLLTRRCDGGSGAALARQGLDAGDDRAAGGRLRRAGRDHDLHRRRCAPVACCRLEHHRRPRLRDGQPGRNRSAGWRPRCLDRRGHLDHHRTRRRFLVRHPRRRACTAPRNRRRTDPARRHGRGAAAALATVARGGAGCDRHQRAVTYLGGRS